MARGVNKAIILGTMGQDPEVRYTPNGAAVATISVATNEQWTDKKTGEKQEHTEWHRVVFFSRLAEVVQQYMSKGSQIYIEGRIRTNKWQDKEGKDRYTTEIIANEMQMLGSKGDRSTADFDPSPTPTTSKAPATPPATSAVPSNDDFDDDIPF